MTEEIREQLDEALSLIDRPGSFCASGSAPSVLPGLEVEGLGPVGLPVTQKQAKELIKYCKQAPYGKGEKTLVDRSVRRVWRMEPDRFSLTNPDWDQFIKTTVGKVQEALGLEKQKLESHLYDLLLYEPGSFFLPHRDGEKLDRMVATLIVVLPSNYEGGELVVCHEGREETIDFQGADANPLHTHFAAFYADCEHEVRRLRKGYRLCLVYNLVLAKSKKTITAPRASEHVERIGQLLREWAADDTEGKLVITLDHQYTEAGLSWDALKGVDRARAKILSEAAKQADCKAYLALLTFYESGSAEYSDSGGYYSRRWGGYDDYDSDDASDYEMEEVFESSLTANAWSDSDGHPLPIGELSVEEDELVDSEGLRDIEPQEEFEGYTGNEGMTLERWYRHASVILWPLRRHFEIICDRNGKHAVPELERMVAQLRRSKPGDKAALRAQCLELARAIFKTWRDVRFGRPGHDEANTTGLLDALAALDDPELIARFFQDLLAKDATLEIGKSVASVCEKHGWATFQSALQAAMAASSNETLERNVQLLEQICTAKPRKKAGWAELCARLGITLVAALQRIDRGRSESEWGARKVDRAEVLAGLARALISTTQTDVLADVVTHALATPKRYPLTTTHVPALTQLRSWLKKTLKQPDAAVSAWVASCREQLESLTAREPEEPKDFRRSAKIVCKCNECAELKRFLANPKESVHRFSVREERRKHLANSIHNSQSDLDLKTETRGSPHTLICTKNLASFHKKVKTYHENQEHLATVRAIEASLPKGSSRGG